MTGRRREGDSSDESGRSDAPRSKLPWVLTAFVVLGVVIGTWAWRQYTVEKRLARQDASALSSAVAEFAGAEGRLPRVTATRIQSPGGDIIWGPDFRVESELVPRADPTSARLVAVVGDAAEWCVEVLYNPPSLIGNTDPAWVKVHGESGVAGKVVDGRCGEGFVVTLSPVTSSYLPAPETVVDAIGAPVGACLVNPFTGESAGGAVADTGLIELTPCQQGHWGEIYFAGEMSGESFVDAWEPAANECAAAFEPFVGVPYTFSTLAFEPFTVTQEEWEAGERSFTCVLYLGGEEHPLVGSARDSWR